MNKEKILEQLDKVKFYQELLPSLKVNGRPEALALCPFHDDKNPSLSVNIKTGLYFCPVCNDGGDVFKFYMRLKQVSFKDALNQLAGCSGQFGGKATSKIECVYQYRDETCQVLFEVVRYTPKTFRQRRPDGKGGYVYSLDGARIVPYNLPVVIANNTVYICEGEKDCDSLARLGLAATTNPQGAGKWRDEFGRYFTGKDVVVFCDNDEPGRRHGHDVARKLSKHANTLKVIEQMPGVPHKGDVSDWLKTPGNTKDKLMEIVRDAPVWTPSNMAVVNEVNVVNDAPEEKIEITDFPVEVFPIGLKEMVLDVSNSMGIPASVTGSVTLTILATAIGNTVKISPKIAFEVSPFLWTCVVMPTGSGKSPLLELLTRPIKNRQASAYRRYKNELKQHQLSLRAFKKNESDEIPDEPVLEQYLINDSYR